MGETIRVMIVDDHAIVREGLRTLLLEEPGFEVVGEAASGAEVVRVAAECKPDVALMDLMMPGVDGIEATARLRAAFPAVHVVALTSFGDDERVRRAIQAGAIGYLLKDVLKADLLAAIRAAASGQPALHPEAQRVLMRPAEPTGGALEALTPREREVLALIAQGKSNKEIAESLSLTRGTVKGYVSIVLDKLDVADRTQAALFAVRHGLGGR